ncbi:hypothetical protein AB1N83_010344 [Pleurotus pulmonarius]
MSVLSIPGANGGCPSASYLSETLEFYFRKFANLCQSVERSIVYSFDHPSLYLNGTAPLNVTGASEACVFPLDGEPGTPVCTTTLGADRDSFLWVDELHPSEQADRIVAREIAEAIRGKANKWTTWLS